MALYPLVRPLAFALDAERAHALAIAALKRRRPAAPPPPDPALAMRVAELSFPNPVGLAAGFDKNAEVFRQMLGLGFGFVEVGTLTPRPQPGNPRPRLFRLVEDRGVINRLGFNNRGQAEAATRLAGGAGGLVGVNIGANKDSEDRIADYAAGVRAMTGVADYLTVNISSPNTPGLRALQDAGALDALLEAVIEARGAGPPVFLKLAPDLVPADIDAIARVAIDRRVDALIVANTTVSRPILKSPQRDEAGGLSGAPLGPLALARLRDFAKATGGTLPLIAAGGIASGADALARIRAGASLVQLYTAMVYEGPGLARRINRELKLLLAREGFARLEEAIGVERS
ncbi:quinone-dependent dihydroorotate dehydrogenase [Sphingosinicella ginsenosidimutans]|uniref:Dihydroorotate dehydrogenase (quinone) n=1 Tax=Allosphingosinicella ginsenosidimutans TaxID=1176539 RepID=A0A5C6TSH1_9SPHN|nr:quinone-dependent dihydroorotate dehydrogenase [Sphingosinicella ginsenosidimutans]TXC63344.1 quinone-dependent dihydroorotate dehydrogenase [Sphingosinicella ginsenosidimutans]